MLHAGGKFGDGGYKVSGGLHGVGVSVVNALSAHLIVEVRRDGYHWRQIVLRSATRRSAGAAGAESTRPAPRSPSTPAPTIFETTTYSLETLATRFREMAFLNKGLTITIVDERPVATTTDPTTTWRTGATRLASAASRPSSTPTA